MAVKVKLRKYPITGNRQSLYIDYYPAIINPKNGKLTRREFLGMYILDNAKTPLEKQANKETIQLAEQIMQNRVMQYNKSEIYTGYEKEQLRLKV